MPENHQGWRICTGSQEITTVPGVTYPNNQYAASLLDLLADASLLTQDKPQPYDYRWNPVTPNSCRDLISTTDIDKPKTYYFMVGPGKPGGYWDAKNVAAINAQILSIDWKASQQ